MKKRIPFISVILPTYNEEKNIKSCLESIRRFDYPQNKVEIIVIDDYSTDRTVEIAKAFGSKIFYNGSHNCEIGRSIGLKKAKGELVLIIDADNILPGRYWLKKFVQPFLDNPHLAGVQSGWYSYEKKATMLNRYCALFGATKPLAFYLKKRCFLMATEKDWPYPETLQKNKKNYFLVKFTPSNLPTLGSQGYLAKRELILKTTYQPFFFHVDSVYESITQGHDLFAIVKVGIIHHHVDSFWNFHRKYYRDLRIFFALRHLRKDIYRTSKLELIKAILTMVTIVIPLVDSIKGFLKKRDSAWFLHPILCQTTLWLTFFMFLKWSVGFRDESFSY